MTVLQTERLIGRPPSDDRDFAGLRQIHADPRAAATLSVDARPFPEAVSRAMFARAHAHFRRHGHGPWFWFEKDGGDFVGYCGITRSVIDSVPMVELLYGLRAVHWRRGYASEAAAACIDFAFEELGFEELIAIALPRNVGSRAVMKKLGFVFERPATHMGLLVLLTRLRRSAWRR